jgi:recombination protein RecT
MSKTGQEVAVATVTRDITVKVLEKINTFQASGELTLPPNYSPENALKSAFLILSETVDKEKRPVLESCSQASIANSLLQMINFGLSPSKGQVYFIAFGGKLSIMKSYMGNMAIAKRVGNVKTINAQVIYKADTFEYGVNIEDGSMEIKKHETSFDSIDSSEIIGAYAVVKFNDGSKKVDVMTAKQIQTSFEQSYTKGNSPAHLKFQGEMFKKTVINRVLKTVIGSSDDSNLYNDDEIPTTEQIVAEEIEKNANSEFIDFTTFDDPIPEVKEVKEKVTKVNEEPKNGAMENAVVENGQIEAGF